jgi:CubicO group peptidase (beta-lactamase class C family)
VLAQRRNGYQVWRAASGVSDVDGGAAMRAGDRFRIGSNTKTFVSTVVLQLVAEQRLRLTDSVQRWLPGIVPNDSAITVRQLLTHTSGLFDYTEDPRLVAPYATDPGYFWPPHNLVAWGHGGAFPGYRSVALTSPDGSRQAVIALNTDRILTDQTLADLDAAVDLLFCGNTPPGQAARIGTAR